jgi:two-component system, chemotaxis family, CheB/CheR fusion protein
MAQTLDSAKYDAILRSAISTGPVDHVLPVEEMPAKLLDYAAHLVSANGNGKLDGVRAQIAAYIGKVHAILRRRAGHDFSQYKENTIARRLERRMKVLQIETVEQYDQVRVCIVGCASGEEVYSIAMLLCEHAATLDNAPKIYIFATDIDERGLDMARKGRYPASVAENVSAERLERFFVSQDGAYQVKRELREICLFSSHSFVRDPPFSRLAARGRNESFHAAR